MVWGGISLRGRTELHVINNGTLTAQRYRDEILAVHMRPYLQRGRIERMDWPARSPDLNPIEHV